MKVILMTMLLSLSINAARWTPEDLTNDTAVQSDILNEVDQAFEHMADHLNLSHSVGFYTTTARILFKKSAEPLRNSIKQLYHIGASQWRCDTMVDASEDLVAKDLSSLNKLVDLFFDPLSFTDVLYSEKAKDDFLVALYAMADQDNLELVGGSVYCEDEYAFKSIISVFDTDTNELLNLNIVISD